MKTIIIILILCCIPTLTYAQNQADQDERDAYGALTIFYGGMVMITLRVAMGPRYMLA